jgi:hypothetical protein
MGIPHTSKVASKDWIETAQYFYNGTRYTYFLTKFSGRSTCWSSKGGDQAINHD